MKTYWTALYPWLKPHLKKLIITFSLALPLGLIKGGQTYLVKDLFDKGFSPHAPFQQALQLAILIIVLQIINYPCRYFHFYFIKVLSEKIANDMRKSLFDRLMHSPVKYFQSQKQGEILSLLQNDIGVLADSIRFMPGLLREPVSAFSLLCVALYQDWRLTLVLFVVTPIFILIFHKSGKLIRSRVAAVQQYLGAMMHNLSEGLSGQKIIKAYNLQDYATNRLTKSQEKYLEAYSLSASAEEHSHPQIELIASFAFAIILLYAHHRITHGYLTTGGFVSFMASMAFFMDPIRKYTDCNIKLERGKGALLRLKPLMEGEQEIDQGKIKITKFSNSIEIKNLNFKYEDHWVLKNFSMTVSKGQKVGLVGLSGSGKSTLINLLLRLYQYQSGHILLDNIDIKDYQLADYRNLFALVSQDIFLFNDSALENITTGSHYSDEKIKEALTVAHATDFVNDLPEKLFTTIGDRGLRLSGGQSQRMTIARAILRDAPILLFDEATSALDNESEKVVQAALEEMAGNKTVIAVAHRLSTLQNYDRIIVLKNGEKIEEGSHMELLQLKGEYFKLFELGQR